MKKVNIVGKVTSNTTLTLICAAGGGLYDSGNFEHVQHKKAWSENTVFQNSYTVFLTKRLIIVSSLRYISKRYCLPQFSDQKVRWWWSLCIPGGHKAYLTPGSVARGACIVTGAPHPRSYWSPGEGEVIYDYEPHINVLFKAAQIGVNCRKPEADKMSEVIVPDNKSRNIPEVVLVRRWAVGVLGTWRGGVGWVKGGANGVSLQAT